MEIECPMCLGKVLPFKVCQGNLVFLCIDKKVSLNRIEVLHFTSIRTFTYCSVVSLLGMIT